MADNLSDDEVRQLLEESGVKVDGRWGAERLTEELERISSPEPEPEPEPIVLDGPSWGYLKTPDGLQRKLFKDGVLPSGWSDTPKGLK